MNNVTCIGETGGISSLSAVGAAVGAAVDEGGRAKGTTSSFSFSSPLLSRSRSIQFLFFRITQAIAGAQGIPRKVIKT